MFIDTDDWSDRKFFYLNDVTKIINYKYLIKKLKNLNMLLY